MLCRELLMIEFLYQCYTFINGMYVCSAAVAVNLLMWCVESVVYRWFSVFVWVIVIVNVGV